MAQGRRNVLRARQRVHFQGPYREGPVGKVIFQQRCQDKGQSQAHTEELEGSIRGEGEAAMFDAQHGDGHKEC